MRAVLWKPLAAKLGVSVDEAEDAEASCRSCGVRHVVVVVAAATPARDDAQVEALLTALGILAVAAAPPEAAALPAVTVRNI